MRADPRRVRLHQGLSRGEILSRREAVHHRRRYQRNPEIGDRPTASRKEIAGSAARNGYCAGFLLKLQRKIWRRQLKNGPTRCALATCALYLARLPLLKTMRPML